MQTRRVGTFGGLLRRPFLFAFACLLSLPLLNQPAFAQYGIVIDRSCWTDPASGKEKCNTITASAYVQHSKDTAVDKDWNCGSHTYTSISKAGVIYPHSGTDFAIGTIGSKPAGDDAGQAATMQYPHVQVYAGVKGTIVEATDGCDDKCVSGGCYCRDGGGNGNHVKILDQFGRVRALLHFRNQTLKVSCGQSVEPDTLIAEVGSSGNSTGPHLHDEFQDLDASKIPSKFCDGTKFPSGTVLDPFPGPCMSDDAYLKNVSLWVNPGPYKGLPDQLHYECTTTQPGRATASTFQDDVTRRAFQSSYGYHHYLEDDGLPVGSKYPNLGCPDNNSQDPSKVTPFVHAAGNGVEIQDFLESDASLWYQGSTDGWTALVHKKGSARTYLLRTGFWGAYKCLPASPDAPSLDPSAFFGGPLLLGAPTSNERALGTCPEAGSADGCAPCGQSGTKASVVAQHFENGCLWFDAAEPPVSGRTTVHAHIPTLSWTPSVLAAVNSCLAPQTLMLVAENPGSCSKRCIDGRCPADAPSGNGALVEGARSSPDSAVAILSNWGSVVYKAVFPDEGCFHLCNPDFSAVSCIDGSSLDAIPSGPATLCTDGAFVRDPNSPGIYRHEAGQLRPLCGYWTAALFASAFGFPWDVAIPVCASYIAAYGIGDCIYPPGSTTATGGVFGQSGSGGQGGAANTAPTGAGGTGGSTGPAQCGQMDEPCCLSMSPLECASYGLACVNGICRLCGANGQPCCPNSACAAGVCSQGTCAPTVPILDAAIGTGGNGPTGGAGGSVSDGPIGTDDNVGAGGQGGIVGSGGVVGTGGTTPVFPAPAFAPCATSGTPILDNGDLASVSPFLKEDQAGLAVFTHDSSVGALRVDVAGTVTSSSNVPNIQQHTFLHANRSYCLDAVVHVDRLVGLQFVCMHEGGGFDTNGTASTSPSVTDGWAHVTANFVASRDEVSRCLLGFWGPVTAWIDRFQVYDTSGLLDAKPDVTWIWKTTTSNLCLNKYYVMGGTCPVLGGASPSGPTTTSDSYCWDFSGQLGTSTIEVWATMCASAGCTGYCGGQWAYAPRIWPGDGRSWYQCVTGGGCDFRAIYTGGSDGTWSPAGNGLWNALTTPLQ